MGDTIDYLHNDRDRLVNYAERYRSGLPISTSTVESAVESVVGDRFKQNRKMRWTPKGANALLHIRVGNLNGELASALKQRYWIRPRVLATVSGTIARSRGTDDEDLPRRLDDFGSHARRALLV